MQIKKMFHISIFASILIIMLIASGNVQAITTDEIRTKIAALQQQIIQLQQELLKIEEAPAVWCHTFNTNLKYGISGTEVEALQIALEKEGLYQKSTNPPYFDEPLASAAVGFQQKYKEDILAPWGLTYGTGYIGNTTRAKLNEIYGCGETPEAIPKEVTCADTDGGKDYFVKGTAIEDGKSYTDYCYDAFSVKEYFCSNQKVSSGVYVCPNNGSCTNGICVEKTEEEKSITVISPNGGELLYFGHTYTIKWNAPQASRVVIDIINQATGKAASAQIPAVLTNTGSYQWTIPTGVPAMPTGSYKAKITICPESFSEIACANSELSSYGYDESNLPFNINVKPTDSASVCSDSDNGKAYFTKGAVTDDGINYTDACASNITLKEYFCLPKSTIGLGGVAIDYYGCVYGCVSGICNKGLTVTSPTIGTKWLMGNTYNIKWASNNLDIVSIVLLDYRAGRSYYTIATGVPAAAGSYSWKIPKNVFTGSNYVFRIWIGEYQPPKQSGDWEPLAATAENAIYDESANYFSIQRAEKLTLNSPNGGEEFLGNESYIIDWNQTGDIYEAVDILLAGYDDMGNQINEWQLIVAGANTNQGYIAWAPYGTPLYVPSTFSIVPAKYKIRIREATNHFTALSDISDDYFYIIE